MKLLIKLYEIGCKTEYIHLFAIFCHISPWPNDIFRGTSLNGGPFFNFISGSSPTKPQGRANPKTTALQTDGCCGIHESLMEHWKFYSQNDHTTSPHIITTLHTKTYRTWRLGLWWQIYNISLYIKVIVQVSASPILQTPKRDRAYPVICLESSDDFDVWGENGRSLRCEKRQTQ